MNGGIYAYRTRKPGARLRIPLLSFHWGYVGRTSSFYHRHRQHTLGGGAYGAEAKPWADLVVRCYRLPCPRLLQPPLEALAIWTLMPVYNVALNRHNPRRIRPMAARQQRLWRNHGRRLPSVRVIHVVLYLAAFVALWYLIGRWV